MKLRLILIAAALLSLTGCEKVVEPPPKVSYAEIISAIPSWNTDVLKQANDDQTFLLLFLSVIGGFFLLTRLLYGIGHIICCFRGHPDPRYYTYNCNCGCGYAGCDEEDPDDPTYPATDQEYTEVEQILEDFPYSSELEFAKDALEQKSLTKGEVIQAREIYNKLNT